MIALPPKETGTITDIQIVVGEEESSLIQVIFGDVWVCFVNYNIVFIMKNIFNSSEYIAAYGVYNH